MPKPKLLLLDANVIVDAHIHGIWDQLKAKYEIAVPSIVANEAHFYTSETETGNKIAGGINLPAEADRGEIAVFEGTLTEIQEAFAGISDVFMDGVDAGEREAIALIRCGKCDGYSFCTGDTNAIKAMGLLALDEHSVSFESVVNGLKLPHKLGLDPSVSERALRYHLAQGREFRMSGIYAAPPKKKKKR